MSNIFEFDDGSYYYIDKIGDNLIAGTACNVGLIPQYEIKYDDSFSYDQNLETLYYEILDNKLAEGV